MTLVIARILNLWRRAAAGSLRRETKASPTMRQTNSAARRPSVTVRLSAMREGMKKCNGKAPAIAASDVEKRGAATWIGIFRSELPRLSRRLG
ncbi:hypothetical protein [Jiella pelagia]|uniref:Uncharacterized protein n=1 Tax=Jiella pelagia TaxID=2986949 RepID=A0ABY7BXN8_9HYPH|nr:hypothetical protein [Jiella pelagia]WAP67420.1 hypothetical protein OH818_18030 [Jiella pelagia]